MFDIRTFLEFKLGSAVSTLAADDRGQLVVQLDALSRFFKTTHKGLFLFHQTEGVSIITFYVRTFNQRYHE